MNARRAMRVVAFFALVALLWAGIDAVIRMRGNVPNIYTTIQVEGQPVSLVEARQLWAEQALAEGGIPNVTPPIHLDILMDPRDAMQTGMSMRDRCLAWGGLELEFVAKDGAYICPDIDY